jgi:hypothetical protein
MKPLMIKHLMATGFAKAMIESLQCIQRSGARHQFVGGEEPRPRSDGYNIEHAREVARPFATAP